LVGQRNNSQGKGRAAESSSRTANLPVIAIGDKKGSGLISGEEGKRVLTPFWKQLATTSSVAGPLTRTMPRAAPPVAEAIAAMVSSGS
jgi:hypothetical protein